jgi:hypothetical protein
MTHKVIPMVSCPISSILDHLLSGKKRKIKNEVNPEKRKPYTKEKLIVFYTLMYHGTEKCFFNRMRGPFFFFFFFFFF